MKFESHFSSSKHNLYTVTAANGKRLLIECGCTWKQLLRAINHDLTNIVACCVTHNHDDHSHCIEKVMENGIDVYASEGTFNAIEPSLHLHRKAKAIRALERFYIKSDFICMPFAVEHDASEPLGFVISKDNENLLFITDTFMVTQKFGLAFNIIALCCNYDGDLLKKRVDSGDINETFAKRLLDNHTEWHTTKSYIKDCCNLDKCTEIWLLHMSCSNIDQEKVRAEFEREFMITTLIAEK